MATYNVYGAAVFSFVKPNHAAIYPPNMFQTTEVTEAQLIEFIMFLDGWTIITNALTDPLILADIRNQTRRHLWPPGGGVPRLSGGNPITNIYVNDSRPVGGQQVWQGSSTFSIHPVASPNEPPVPPIPIAVAAHRDPNGVVLYWISADVYVSLL